MREQVHIHTPAGILSGELFVGSDGLPELQIPSSEAEMGGAQFRPATLPNEWHLRPVSTSGELLAAWYTVDIVRRMIAQAEREEDEEWEIEDEPDEMEQAKADMEARGER